MKVGFIGLLTLLFVAGKIFGSLNWSWWLVFSPIYVTVIVFFVIGVLYGLVEYASGKK